MNNPVIIIHKKDSKSFFGFMKNYPFIAAQAKSFPEFKKKIKAIFSIHCHRIQEGNFEFIKMNFK